MKRLLFFFISLVFIPVLINAQIEEIDGASSSVTLTTVRTTAHEAAQATTVYINGVTTNVEAVIPASSSFKITCIDATHWILQVWDANGAYSAPVPDAV